MIKILTVVLFISFLVGCAGAPKSELIKKTSLKRITSKKESLKKEISNKDISKKQSLIKEVSSKDISKKQSLIKEVSSKDISKKQSLIKEVSSKDISKKQSLIKEISKKEGLKNTIFAKKEQVTPLECSVTPLTEEERSIKRSMVLLEKFFKEWKSVKHRMGGLSKRGIDCSGFVQLTFKKQFKVKIPRTTRFQVRLGKTISKNKLKAGDLVFFKTSPRVKHVGIYLKDNTFIHTSSSKGVMKSKLNKGYWARKYWTAKRISFKTNDFFNEVIRRGQA